MTAELENCSICKFKRYDAAGNPIWKSDLQINFHKRKGIMALMKSFTVCPKCRHLSLNEIFKILIDNQTKKEKTKARIRKT